MTFLGAEQRATHNSVIIEDLQQTSLSTSDTVLSKIVGMVVATFLGKKML